MSKDKPPIPDTDEEALSGPGNLHLVLWHINDVRKKTGRNLRIWSQGDARYFITDLDQDKRDKRRK